jgi:four helix bundle protein
MRKQELNERTKQFALRIIRMYGVLPKRTECDVIGRQVLRSGTSVAANYREAGRARTKLELASKLSIVLQELDETQLWLELLIDAGFVKEVKLKPLHAEADELIRIMVASIRTLNGKTESR